MCSNLLLICHSLILVRYALIDLCFALVDKWVQDRLSVREDAGSVWCWGDSQKARNCLTATPYSFVVAGDTPRCQNLLISVYILPLLWSCEVFSWYPLLVLDTRTSPSAGGMKSWQCCCQPRYVHMYNYNIKIVTGGYVI